MISRIQDNLSPETGTTRNQAMMHLCDLKKERRKLLLSYLIFKVVCPSAEAVFPGGLQSDEIIPKWNQVTGNRCEEMKSLLSASIYCFSLMVI